MKPQTTIAQIIPRLDTGGAELATVEIGAALVRAGARALVLTEGGRLAGRLAQTGAKLVPFPAATKNPIRMLANARTLRRLAGDERIDLFHVRSRAPAWSALLAARRIGCPLVMTYHGAYGERSALKRLYNSVMVRGDIVIANSRFTADLIRARYGTPEERIRVIHRGIDPAAFDPASVSPERIAAIRVRWRVAPEDKIVLHPARLTSWKGQKVVIAAAGRLAAEGRLNRAVIVFAGDAQGRTGYVHALERQIAAAGLEDRVRLTGHVEDMPAALCAAHVAVVASIEPEAFGRTAVEAQAMGCPVIASDLGALPETVLAEPRAAADGNTGWLVAPGDAAALADKIAAALTLDRQTRAVLGGRARAHVLAHFSLRAMQRATLAVYDRLLGTTLAEATSVHYWDTDIR